MVDALGNLIGYTLAAIVLPLAITLGLTLLALRVVSLIGRQINRRFITPIEDPDRRARLRTVYRAVKNGVQALIIAVGTLIALSTLGINVGPALTAAGILGLAVSLGAQTLIKDFIGGFTVLLEDQYRVGDSVRIGAVTGDVERITLRRTDLRDAEGRLFIVPNGEVRVVANETRGWARAVVEFDVDYDMDPRKAVDALEAALDEAAEDPRVKPHLLEAPEVFGWSGINERGVVVRLRAKVKAGRQGEVGRVLRERGLDALHAAGDAAERDAAEGETPRP